MLTGGWADKLGNRYEGRWTAKQLLRLLDGKLQAVQLETVTEEHLDLLVNNLDGTAEAQQCKRKMAGSGWTIRELAGKGVISSLQTYLSAHQNGRFVFVSNQLATDLKRLTDAARNSADLPAFQSAIAGAKDQKAWTTWCKTLGAEKDPQTAHDLLRRTQITPWADDIGDLYDFATSIVVGEPREVVLTLADYALDRMGQRIHADTVRRFIERETSFELRDLAHSETIPPVIETCCREYRDGIVPYLIKGQLMARPEARALFESIKLGDKRTHVVHGGGGQGKSCILYELTTILEENGIPFLPIRLDTRVPRDNSRAFGRQLGFPESPVRCLLAVAGSRTPVLILDQLDALRWLPQHDHSSWAVFLELANEVFQSSTTIHMVVACRTFDLKHDAQISAWRNNPERSLAIEEILVGDMAEESVKTIAGDSWATLTSAQRDLLRKPHLLYIWHTLREESAQQFAFRTATELMRRFWEHVRTKLTEGGCPQADVNAAVANLVNRLDRSGELAAPESTMDEWPRVRRGLLSLAVLQRTDGKLRFVHQSYFDHYLATLWLQRLRDEGKTVQDWLTANDEQSLLRRGQLRHLLAVIRDDDPSLFVPTLRGLLGAPSVRFHLQHLTLQFLGSIPNPTQDEVNIVLEKLHDSSWRDAVVTQVIAARPQWVRALDERHVLRDWLSGPEGWQTETAYWVLRTVAETDGDRVAANLEQLTSKPSRWPARAWNILPHLPEADSTKIFDIRLRLVRSGIVESAEFCFNDEFSKRYPRRAIQLLATAVEAENEKPAKEDRLSRREGWPYWLANHTANAIKSAVDSEPAFAWQTLVPCQLVGIAKHPSLLGYCDAKPFARDALWNDQFYRSENGSVALPAIVASAGGGWLRSEFTTARNALLALPANESRTVQQIVGTAWLQGPDEAADDAIAWLINDNRRFLLGHIGKDQRWALARDLIARFSAICSPEKFAQMERALLRYHSPDEVAAFKFNLEAYAGGKGQYRANEYDLSQHALLPALPLARRSRDVANAIGQLQQKYPKSAESMECAHEPKGGWVTSPVSSRAARLSDAAWLQLITKDPDSRGFRERWFPDHMLESSPDMFGRDLWHQAERQPARFAALALKLPQGIPAVYWGSLLRALRLTQPPDEKLTDWEPATEEQCRAVLDRVGYHPDREVGVAFCNLVAMRPKCGPSPSTLQALCRYATEHPDPQHDGCVLPKDSKERLDTEAINTVRACAAGAIATLLFEDIGLLKTFEPAIRRLMADDVACVRAAAIAALLAILNMDRELAVDLFLRAVSTTDQQVLRTRHARGFIGHVLPSHLSRVKELISGMASSPLADVAEDGAAWTTTVYLFKGECKPVFEQCARGVPAQRKGVAETLVHHVHDDRVAAKCSELLPQFFDDPESDVRGAASTVVRRGIDWSKKTNIDVLRSFLSSRAFLDQPRTALWMLEKFTGDLRLLSEPIFAACDSAANLAAESGSKTGWELSATFETLSVLLLRLYGQAQSDPALREKCLDRWDAILRSGSWVTSRVFQHLDEQSALA